MKKILLKIKKYFNDISNKKLLLTSIVVLLALTIFIGKSFSVLQPVKSIEIFSKNTSY